MSTNSDPRLSVVEPADFQCSIIREARDTDTHVIGFRDALSGIKTGRWAKQVGVVREAYGSGGREAAADPKKLLPGILFSGTFSRRAADALLKPSGLICADLDHLEGRVSTLKEHLISDDHVLAVFVSPTGTGLKVVFRCNPAKDHKNETFPALEKYVADHFGELIDEKCDDVCRICFVSHDPDLWANDDAKVIPYPAPEPKQPPKEFILPSQPHGVDQQPGADFNLRGGSMVPDILRAHGWTHLRGIYWCRPGKTGGVSATWGHYENTLIVHSSSPETGFPSDRKGFDPFAIYTHLICRGDWKQATRELAKQGYGAPAKSRQQENLDRLAGPPSDAIGQGADEEAAAIKRDETGGAPQPIAPERARELALKALFSRRVTATNPPVEPITRLFLAGKPVATPGNIQTMTAKAKTGKTAATGATIAAVICASTGADVEDRDTFKFSASNPNGHAVIVIDTEQSPYDAWACYQRNLARAGTNQDPPWLLHFALVGYNVKSRKEALSLALDYAKTAFGGVFLVILDGVAHFVSSVNELEECNTLADWLRELSVTYDTAMLCIIHSNEGIKTGDDSRGHLGKQLMRDAESNLLLKKDGEITTITSERQRKAPITPEDGVAFKWSDAEQRHITCKSGANAKDEAKRERSLELAEAVFEHLGRPRAKYNEVVKAIETVRNVGGKRAEERFTEMKKAGVIAKDLVGNWSVTPATL